MRSELTGAHVDYAPVTGPAGPRGVPGPAGRGIDVEVHVPPIGPIFGPG
ncbi:hypothetical protein [Frankia sp. AgKG'84/4]|nr:hypothetical protein [Frankia sp. AgKG'84/4]MCL9796037.1 hypothetical protein [Frankia sp. AgKG'84/4]